MVLPDDAFVVLDPAVEVLGVEVAGHALLCHLELDVGMAVPPGDGLLDFVTSLRGAPVAVRALRAGYDDHALIDEMLGSLRRHGFVQVTSSAPPPDDAWPALREAAGRAMARGRRRPIDVDLDGGGGDGALDAIGSAGGAAEVLLRCARLADHAAMFDELARRRRAGALRVHHTIVRTVDARCDAATRAGLVRLGAAVEIAGVAWPAPDEPVPGLDALVGDRVPAYVRMRADLSILDETVRARVLGWARDTHVTGLCLQLDPAAIGDRAVAVLDAVRALEHAIGDVVIADLPGDEVLLGNTAGVPGPCESDAARRFRHAYLRWRVPLLKATESTCTWAQVPEAEARWVRDGEDLLPNHPELLGLGPGSVVVDVAGGLGRVARRLSPSVGADGVIVSIEIRRFLTEQARRFACDRGFTNLQFRPGLAERLPLADASADAAVNEWTGAIWELGLGPTMVAEMARVVRPGGRVAVTHRLVQLRVDALAQPWVQYPDIHRWARDAFARADLTVVAERIWGQIVPSRAGERAAHWVEQYLPRLVDPNDGAYPPDAPSAPRADVFLTLVGERPVSSSRPASRGGR